MNRKSKDKQENLEARAKEIAPENPETKENPENPKTVRSKKLQIHVKKAKVDLIMSENGANLIILVTNAIECLVTRLLVNLQKDGVKGTIDKADGFQRSFVMMEKAKCKSPIKNAVINTKNLHVAKKV